MGKTRVLITGANGFVGRNLILAMTPAKVYEIVPITRKEIGNFGPETNWAKFLEGVDVVVHLAAFVHQMNENAESSQNYRLINTEGTLALAKAAVSAGVKHFIFMSSAKVLGENTQNDHTYSDHSKPNPQDSYSRSKREAEIALVRLSESSSMALTILRPPLIYGPGVKANFLNLLNLVKKGLPLPLGNIQNKRSLIGIRNLNSAILFCIENPSCRNKNFLVSDGPALSTSALIQKMAAALKTKVLLLPLPHSLTWFIAKVLGRENFALRLLGSFHVEDTQLRALGWKPPFSVEEELLHTTTA